MYEGRGNKSCTAGVNATYRDTVQGYCTGVLYRGLLTYSMWVPSSLTFLILIPSSTGYNLLNIVWYPLNPLLNLALWQTPPTIHPILPRLFYSARNSSPRRLSLHPES